MAHVAEATTMSGINTECPSSRKIVLDSAEPGQLYGRIRGREKIYSSLTH